MLTGSGQPDKTAMQYILVINSGSSSIKFKIIALPKVTDLVDGSINGIGGSQGEHKLVFNITSDTKESPFSEQGVFVDHANAFACVLQDIDKVLKKFPHLRIDAVGHRVVHGGTRFISPVRLNLAILEEIAALDYLAPQHIPGNVIGMKMFMQLFADTPQVAVFDTGFHQNMPEYAYRYPVPEKWFKEFAIRRFGFHGSSHQYVMNKAAELLSKPVDQLNLISLHLGNGDSACAIQKGHSIDTSMGFTPLEGLMMGARCGDIDASIPLYLQKRHGLSIDEVDQQLNFESGLYAICQSSDMSKIVDRAQGDDDKASLALDMFIYRIRKYIGAYLVILGDVDAIIFTGGIGENSPYIRARCCQGLMKFGIKLDQNRNLDIQQTMAVVSGSDSATKILVVKTEEEHQIAREVSHLLTL